MNRILITGGTGLLGKALIETNRDARISSIYLGSYSMADRANVSYHKADICDTNMLEGIFRQTRPQVVIHTAGIANVDYCEKNYDEAYRANVIGTRNITDLAREFGAKMVFISTNAVFDGKSAPYSEDSTPSPINLYGKMKVESEGILKKSGLKHLIVRPILMYGWNNKHERPNTVTWLIKKLQNGDRVNIVNDVYENPLLNVSCAEIIWELINLNKEGIYHIAGRDAVNRHAFAKTIADVFNLDSSLIDEVSSDFFHSLAPRPRNTSYNTSKIENELNIRMLGLGEGLNTMKNMRKNTYEA